MTFRIAAAFTDAAEIFRSDRDLLLRVGALFFFLPAFGVELFLPFAPPAGADMVASLEAQVDYASAHAVWLILRGGLDLFGEAAILALLLNPLRPTVAMAMRDAGRLFLPYVIARILIGAAEGVGTLFLIVPGLYILGRTFLVAPLMIGEAERNPIAAIRRGWNATRNRGWTLFSVNAVLLLPGLFVASILRSMALAAGDAAGPVTVALLAAGVAFVQMAVSVATLLLQVAVWRQLGPRTRGM